MPDVSHGRNHLVGVNTAIDIIISAISSNITKEHKEEDKRMKKTVGENTRRVDTVRLHKRKRVRSLCPHLGTPVISDHLNFSFLPSGNW
jgi:hypothetical protein